MPKITIVITDEKLTKINELRGAHSPNSFVKAGLDEKINRIIANDKRAKRETLKADANALLPILLEIINTKGPEIRKALSVVEESEI